MARTIHWEGHAHGGIPWRRLRRSFQNDRHRTPFLYRAALWRTWLDCHIPTVMADHLEDMQRKGLGYSDLRRSVVGDVFGPLDRRLEHKLRKSTQSWMVKGLQRDTLYDAHRRMKDKLCRWHQPGLPRRLATRVLRQLNQLRKLCQPRIVSASLSTIWNRWTTERRMTHLGGHNRGCLFGCSSTAADSIEHYFSCAVVRRWRDQRLPHCVRDHGLQHALLISRMSDAQLKAQGLLTYVVYRTTNHIRHSTTLHTRPGPDYVRHFMSQMLHEGLRGGSTILDLQQQVSKRRAVTKRKHPDTSGSSRTVRRRT
jgi:hypothetical protein